MTITWLRFGEIMLLLVSLFSAYELYRTNSTLKEEKIVLEKKVGEVNTEIKAQKALTAAALDVKQEEQTTTQTIIKFVDKADKQVVKENPQLAEDATKLWKEAVK